MSETQSALVKSVIEEASNAYLMYIESAHMNTDFAEFASLSYKDLQSALGCPEMTKRQIRRLLRRSHQSALKLPPESCWVSFMAGYMTMAANKNVD